MARTKGEMTKLALAKTKSNSLRTTVPSFIVKTLHLQVGDQLDWDFDPDNRERLIVRVIRSKTNQDR